MCCAAGGGYAPHQLTSTAVIIFRVKVVPHPRSQNFNAPKLQSTYTAAAACCSDSQKQNMMILFFYCRCTVYRVLLVLSCIYFLASCCWWLHYIAWLIDWWFHDDFGRIHSQQDISACIQSILHFKIRLVDINQASYKEHIVIRLSILLTTNTAGARRQHRLVYDDDYWWVSSIEFWVVIECYIIDNVPRIRLFSRLLIDRHKVCIYTSQLPPFLNLL